MKVLLINPSSNRVDKNLDTRAAAPPLGLLYIASSLIKDGHEIKLIDQGGSFIDDNKIIQIANSFNPELVCFSVMGEQSISAARIAIFLKKTLPGVKILFGGINPTFNAEMLLGKYSQVDFCIQGEGEESILEFINGLKTNNFNKVHGLVYRNKKTIKKTLPQKLIENLDSLPFPDRELVKDIEYGFVSGFCMKKFTTIVSSRGCPYECKYCCCNSLSNRKWRTRSVNNVLDELSIIQEQGYKTVLFSDDTFTLDEKRVIELSQGIRKRGIDLNFAFEGRVDNAHPEMLKEMVKAGTKVAYFGGESANQRILKWYNKAITPIQTKLAVKNSRAAGMDFIVASFILGCPTESKQEVENTINFMTKLDVDFVQVTQLVAYPGTLLWKEMVNKGYIDLNKDWETGVYVSLVHPESLPYEYLRAKVQEAYARFVGNWKVKARHVLRLLKSRFRQKIFFNNFDFFTKGVASNLVNKNSESLVKTK